MAAELKTNVHVAKRAGLFHDIGKAIDREMDGTHLQIGIDLLRKYGETEEVVHAMACHHGDYDPETVEAVLVTAADACRRRARARREILETYVKRLKQLEEIAGSFKGVQKTFRDPGRPRDPHHRRLREDLRRGVDAVVARHRARGSAELTYPGQIKVTVIRETRAVEFAK